MENKVVKAKFTHLGTAMILLEIGSLRFLTDPIFDSKGSNYNFGTGIGGSVKLQDPVIPVANIGKIDAVLLSHDEHADNLDKLGRAFLPNAGIVITTYSGGKRLSSPPDSLKNVRGLKEWESYEIKGSDGFTVKVTAAPGRHGPPLSSFAVGDVIGFVLEWPNQKDGVLYISGDTVQCDGVMEVGKKFKVSTMVAHLGGVWFPITLGLRLTFNGEEASKVAKTFKVNRIIPIHFEGWTHFKETKEDSMKAFHKAGIAEKVTWPELGKEIELDL